MPLLGLSTIANFINVVEWQEAEKSQIILNNTKANGFLDVQDEHFSLST